MAPLAGVWDGTLSAEEFERAALYLVTIWKRCCPDLPQWTWQTSQMTVLSAAPGRACGYLVLQDVHVSSALKDDVELVDESDEDDPEDQSTMCGGLVVDHEQHFYTYHVVYNDSYRVPMLFLQGRLQDGRPLQWSSVLRDLPLGSQHVSSQSRWTFLTQEDHPLLHRPWFALHPCGTSEIMQLFFPDFSPQNQKDIVFDSRAPEDLSDVSALPEKWIPLESSCESAEIAALKRTEGRKNSEGQVASYIEKYVLTWMSFACPAVGLAIPPRLFVEASAVSR